MTAEFETITFAVDGNVAVVTLNRPDRMNALNAKLKQELAWIFDRTIPADDRIRCVIITGAGRAFCAGADIKERAGQQVPAPAFFFAQKATHELFGKIVECERPVIAAINGAAFGGGAELALACDLRLVAADAKLGLPEVQLGMIPLGGGTQRLPRLIGAARAKELIFTAATIEADEAVRIGLVNRAVPPDQLMSAAHDLAAKIAAMPPLAIKYAKRAINTGLQADMTSALDGELYAGAILNDSQDRHEGMRAFVEKRKPEFTGR